MSWIDFVKLVANRDNIKFNEALKVASIEYHKLNGTIRIVKKKQKNLDRLTGKKILRVLKSKLDSGELTKGMSKKSILEELRKNSNV
jgi:predicted transcriptional regulator